MTLRIDKIKLSTKDTPQDLFYSSHVVRLSGGLLKKADQILKQACDVTHAQFLVLVLLKHHQQISQHQIAEKLCLTGAAISRLTETLVSKQMINRQENPDNRRQNTLSLTKSGEARAEKGISILKELETELYSQIAPEKLAVFIEVTKTLGQIVNQEEKGPFT